jgi:hypothetical protein
MFGEAFLVCPKLTPPDNATAPMYWIVRDCKLPEVDSNNKDLNWYLYQLPNNLTWCGNNCGPYNGQTFAIMNMTDSELPVFVRGGSILPKPFYSPSGVKSVKEVLAMNKV